MIVDIDREKLKKFSPKQIAQIGNIDPVILVISDCNLVEYLTERIKVINSDDELLDLALEYKGTQFWSEAINKVRGEYDRK